ncbi:hypothetical protein C6503_14525 [Candidatus Poribacteria bacterium]|nr:MAG: hypothetical protein C6503_14525 [Candidatus Poribacteria bacterium]
MKVKSFFEKQNLMPAYIPQAKAWGFGGKSDKCKNFKLHLEPLFIRVNGKRVLAEVRTHSLFK